jgi:DNA adenine methylase
MKASEKQREFPLQAQPAPGGGMPRPFLKWAGGKRQLLPKLLERLNRAPWEGTYHEPFLGGGALFFELWRTGLLRGRRAVLSDANPNLMDAYLGLRDDPEAVIQRLVQHTAAHGKDHYYATRALTPENLSLPERAARIIYLNRTCFNGLYRENSKGLFNVPMGRYKDPRICDAANLRAAAAALAGAELHRRDFAEAGDAAQAGDFVYFDPPYHPLSDTANFTAYEKSGFGASAQERLAGVFARLHGRGVYVMLSNSWTPLIRGLYAGFRLQTVKAARSVNRDASKRGAVDEALVTNF